MNASEFQLRARFRHACKVAQVPDGSVLLVAVSGGCDSVSLLRLCHDEASARGWRLVVGHVDHALRPESAEDAVWVREQARSLGLAYLSVRRDPERWCRPGHSLEAEARRFRRRQLRLMARRVSSDWIVLGHTEDDQAETVLMNLLRGSGLRGLTAMPAFKPPVFRPLLRVPRSLVRAFAEARRLSWREDSSNQDLRFLRNRIRARLLPLLQREFHPAVSRVVARTAEALRPTRDYLDALALQAWSALQPEADQAGIRLDRPALASYDQAVVEGVLWRAYFCLRKSPRDLKQAHLTALAHAVRQGRPREFHLPAGVLATVSHREIHLTCPTRSEGDPMVP